MQKFGFFVLLLALAVLTDGLIRLPLQRKKVSPMINARHNLRLPSTAQAPFVTALNGNISIAAEFSVELTLGTPPQTFWLQVDTGSSDLLVYSDGCTGCGTTGISFYNSSASSSVTQVPCSYPNFHCGSCWDTTLCGFEDRYGDGSGVNGSVVFDIMNLVGLQANVSFGKIEQSSPNFEPLAVDGIWGLAYQTITDWNEVPAFPSWASQNDIYAGFSLCLAPVGDYEGVFDLGVDYTSNPAFRYTPVIDELYYVVNLTDVSVGGTSLGLSNKGYNFGPVIVDSGTTLLYVNDLIYEAFVSQISGLCNKGVNLVGVCGVPVSQSLLAGYGYQMTAAQIAAFPVISFSLDGVSNLQVPPTAYLWSQSIPSSGVYYMGIYASGSLTILGDVFMQNFQVAFDLVHNSVGFADPSTCPSPFSTAA